MFKTVLYMYESEVFTFPFKFLLISTHLLALFKLSCKFGEIIWTEVV